MKISISEMRAPPLIRTLHYAWSQLHTEVYKTTPEIRTSPLIRTLCMVPATQRSVQNYP